MIRVVIDSDPRYHVSHTFLRKIVEDFLVKMRVSGKVEVGVLVIGDRKMQDLNSQFRGHDLTTNVLSFPLEDPSAVTNAPRRGFARPPDRVLRLGDVVISYPQAVDEAAQEGIVVEEQIKFLLEHGLEHLLGSHHEEELQ